MVLTLQQLDRNERHLTNRFVDGIYSGFNDLRVAAVALRRLRIKQSRLDEALEVRDSLLLSRLVRVAMALRFLAV